MKRKIAAIFAADIAGYSRLVAEDEEETLKVTGFFKAAGSTMISPDARGDVARRMADAQSGWNAVAVGTAGRPGLGLKATSEQAAVSGALAECARRDSNCQVIAIGPFSVGPN